MESYFREHMAERDLLFHDTMEPTNWRNAWPELANDSQ